ncbi:hypothetical protein EMCRGX_G027157 [Ephydatia muelleri]
MLIKILSCLQLLARQGIPIRGDGDDSESNFIQLLKLSGQGDAKMDEWLKKKTDKYTSHDIQNELLKIMAQHVLRSIAVKIQDSRFVTVMIDETTDVCNQEQVTVVFRTVDDKLIVNEEFIGLYSVDSITADVLTAVIKDVMLRLNLAITKLRRQCYDGCSTMSGSRSDGLFVQILYFGILENHSALMHTWDEAISVARDTESKARIYGVQAQMKKFSFLFGVYLAELVLRHTDNLSKALQCDTVSAAEAQDTAAMVCLWNLAVSNIRKFPSQQKQENSKNLSDSAISLAKIGLHGKACRILLSDGLAPLNNATWELLKSKHPSSPPPITPEVPSTPLSIGTNFNHLPILFSFPKGTAAGPSGLRVQHLIDAAQIPLPIPISTTLRDVVNLLAAGKAPLSVARFLAGGSLTALNKFRRGSPPDVRSIAVGETLKGRLTGKCLCSLVKDKASSFFEPLQLGVACPHGTEKVVHGLRKCIEEHWGDEDFVVLKTDMRNAFNLISRQALLSECSLFFPELLPWASWCYGSQPYLWHPLGHLTSESGVQQGDPLGPLFFSLVLHKVIAAIDADDDCLCLILQAWYLDDGVLAGPKHAVLRALSIIEDLGPSLGIFINLSKCELCSHSDISTLPHFMKASHVPHLDILGTPIGDYLYCTGFFAAKRVEFTKLLSKLEDVSVIDPQVAFNMLRLCSGFCKIEVCCSNGAQLSPPGLL